MSTSASRQWASGDSTNSATAAALTPDGWYRTGDAAVMADETQIELSDAENAEVLVFDLAA